MNKENTGKIIEFIGWILFIPATFFFLTIAILAQIPLIIRVLLVTPTILSLLLIWYGTYLYCPHVVKETHDLFRYLSQFIEKGEEDD